MMTLLEIIRLSETYLADRGIKRARREAEEVIADALEMSRLNLYLQYDRPIAQSELPHVRASIQRRSLHEPIAYISGKVSFGGLSFKVGPGVLIPRPETEILVEKIAQTLKTTSTHNRILWDVCCGSGCLGITLKKRFPQLNVFLSDCSDAALAIAKQNSCVDVTLLQGDLFAPFEGKKCDFFVCNPPYVTEEEYKRLEQEVRDWEPKSALVAGVSGLEFYERIAKELKNYLHSDGLAWLEIGSGQGISIQRIFENEGWSCSFEHDWAGHERFFFASRIV